MALTAQQKAQIAQNFKKLAYLDGEGLLGSTKRDLVNQKFLLVGYGGTGCRALKSLRELLYNGVKEAEIQSKVRFCAVDADHGELDKWLDDNTFRDEEVFKIPFEGAHTRIDPKNMDPAFAPWVNPRLNNTTDIMESWSGKGAGAYRQAGRVLLSLPTSVQEFRRRISEQITSMIVGEYQPRLSVFILTGIAGGTGSGIVIDATYLIHQICETDVKLAPNNRMIAGYVFLPWAGLECTERHNANGYAALKEIDYFMTLHQRGEKFVQDYAGFRVEQEDIFDFCALIDGGADGMKFANHDQVALNVAANSILDMMTSEDAADNRFLVSSMLANGRATGESVVAGQPAIVCPREANYRYAIIGYQRMLVPINLLRIHVAKLLFDPIWEIYDAGVNIPNKKEEAQRILASLGLGEVGGLRQRIHSEARIRLLERFETVRDKVYVAGAKIGAETLDSVIKFAEEAFLSRGPAYTVNITLEMYEQLMELETDAKKREGRNEVEKLEYEKVCEIITKTKDELLKLNNVTYTMMVSIIKNLRKVLKESDAILTNTDEFKKNLRTTYYWSLVDISAAQDADQVIKDYLQTLVDPKQFRNQSNEFLRSLLKTCRRWIAPQNTDKDILKKSIQEFFEERFSRLLDANLEDFLVKLFTGDPKARADTGDDNADRIMMDKAVGGIIARLPQSLPLAITIDGALPNYQKACHKYLAIPKNARRLRAALVNRLGNQYQYFPIEADDSIVSFQVYTGIPAGIFQWTFDGEAAYEQLQSSSVGLHMSEAEGGWNWRRFPSLRPQNPPTREQTILDETEALFERAETLGLTREDGGYFYLSLLRKRNPRGGYNDRLLENAAAGENDAYSDELWNLLQADGQAIDLNAAVRTLTLTPDAPPSMLPLVEKKLDFANMILTYHSDQNVPVPPDWYKSLAVKILRKRLELRDALEGTLMVWKKLADRLRTHNEELAARQRYQELRKSFAVAWRHDLVREEDNEWKYQDQNGYDVSLLNVIREVDQKLRSYSHYYAFHRYAQLPEDLINHLAAEASRRHNEADNEEILKRDQAVNERRTEIIRLNGLRQPEGNVVYPLGAHNFIDMVDRATGETGFGEKLRVFYNELSIEL
jgi:hypothetical protein